VSKRTAFTTCIESTSKTTTLAPRPALFTFDSITLKQHGKPMATDNTDKYQLNQGRINYALHNVRPLLGSKTMKALRRDVPPPQPTSGVGERCNLPHQGLGAKNGFGANWARKCVWHMTFGNSWVVKMEYQSAIKNQTFTMLLQVVRVRQLVTSDY